jgi:hypothetical protein
MWHTPDAYLEGGSLREAERKLEGGEVCDTRPVSSYSQSSICNGLYNNFLEESFTGGCR